MSTFQHPKRLTPGCQQKANKNPLKFVLAKIYYSDDRRPMKQRWLPTDSPLCSYETTNPNTQIHRHIQTHTHMWHFTSWNYLDPRDSLKQTNKQKAKSNQMSLIKSRVFTTLPSFSKNLPSNNWCLGHRSNSPPFAAFPHSFVFISSHLHLSLPH